MTTRGHHGAEWRGRSPLCRLYTLPRVGIWRGRSAMAQLKMPAGPELGSGPSIFL